MGSSSTIKRLFTTFLFLINGMLAFANMGIPYIEGASHNILYGNKECRVIREKINIEIRNRDMEGGRLYGVFRIHYNIHSESDQKIPLLFIGKGLSDAKKIVVNQRSVAPRLLDSLSVRQYPFISKEATNPYYEAQYSVDEKVPVMLDELIYFQADLKKGENSIVVEYEADFGYSTYGFLENYKLDYSLYPSRFWRSFGPIEVVLNLNNLADLTHSNLGKATYDDQMVSWTLNTVAEDIHITVNHRTGWLAKALLYIQPMGIAIVALLFMAWLHICWLKRGKRRRLVLWLGIFLVPMICYVVFFASYSLIDLVLQKQSRHGYIFLTVVGYPLLVLSYGLVIGFFNFRLKNR
jgi:hypothetical protein